jgi:hypothetical protein
MSIDEHFMEFKFHWLDDKGNATSVFRKKGNFDGETLWLEDSEIPASGILSSEIRENSMAISYATVDESNPVGVVLIQLSSNAEAERLKKALDTTRSRVWAETHREELTKSGQGHRFRSEVCPACHATLILSDMPESPQLYCHFCDTLSRTGPDEEPIPQEKELRICEECGMYTRPQKFTIFYFYFLLVVYGWWSKPTWRCPPCMRGDAWKMLFGNLLFIIGVPVALVQLFRSYGGSSVGGLYKGLDSGNIAARNGNLAKAVESYRSILGQVPTSAGIKYNLGIALLAQGNKEKAAASFEKALEDCSNYVPAYHHLKILYEQTGETQKLQKLEQMWSMPEQEENSEEPVFDD